MQASTINIPQKSATQNVHAIQHTIIAFNCENNLPIELHNIYFKGSFNPKKRSIKSGGISLSKGCTDFRVSKNYFTGFANAAIEVDLTGFGNYSKISKKTKKQRGVIYENYFVDNFYPRLNSLGYGVAVYGDRVSWPQLELGTKNAVFVENNVFSGNRHHIASNGSSHYVFRHNRVIHRDTVRNYDMTDARGKSTPNYTGSRSFEIYNNNYVYETKTSEKAGAAIGIRGGDGVIFGNTVSKNIVITVSLYIDRIGRCSSKKIPNGTTSLYIWDNQHNDNSYGNWNIFQPSHPSNPRQSTFIKGIHNKCPQSILKDRHYFLRQKPNYKPYQYPHPLRANSKLNNWTISRISPTRWSKNRNVELTIVGKTYQLEKM